MIFRSLVRLIKTTNNDRFIFVDEVYPDSNNEYILQLFVNLLKKHTSMKVTSDLSEYENENENNSNELIIDRFEYDDPLKGYYYPNYSSPYYDNYTIKHKIEEKNGADLSALFHYYNEKETLYSAKLLIDTCNSSYYNISYILKENEHFINFLKKVYIQFGKKNQHIFDSFIKVLKLFPNEKLQEIYNIGKPQTKKLKNITNRIIARLETINADPNFINNLKIKCELPDYFFYLYEDHFKSDVKNIFEYIVSYIENNENKYMSDVVFSRLFYMLSDLQYI